MSGGISGSDQWWRDQWSVISGEQGRVFTNGSRGLEIIRAACLLHLQFHQQQLLAGLKGEDCCLWTLQPPSNSPNAASTVAEMQQQGGLPAGKFCECAWSSFLIGDLKYAWYQVYYSGKGVTCSKWSWNLQISHVVCRQVTLCTCKSFPGSTCHLYGGTFRLADNVSISRAGATHEADTQMCPKTLNCSDDVFSLRRS